MIYSLPIKRKLVTFCKMSLQQQAFFCINFVLCGIARAAINTLPWRYLTRYFGQFNRSTVCSTLPSEKQTYQARQIGQSVRLAAKYTPWDSSCLTQAMVAKFWCRRYKIPYVFYIGFAKAPDEPTRYKGHAWLTSGSVAVTGGNGFAGFHVVCSYAYLSEKGR